MSKNSPLQDGEKNRHCPPTCQISANAPIVLSLISTMLGDTMSRRSRRRNQDNSTIPDAVTHPHTPLTDKLLGNPTEPASPLTEVEDRRTYHPLDVFRPAMEIGGTQTTQRVVKKSPYSKLPFGLSFAKPDATIICIRRNQRKEVLHAMRKTGRGQSRKRPSKNWYSKIGC